MEGGMESEMIEATREYQQILNTNSSQKNYNRDIQSSQNTMNGQEMSNEMAYQVLA